MTKRVILHLGRPKTGTTALQAFLRLNKPLLETNDISYVGNMAPHAIPFPDFARKIQAASPAQYQTAIKRMRNFFLGRKQSTVIYSNEIHYWSHKVLKAYKAAIGTQNLTVIIYLRRQDEDLQAQYMQGIVDPDVRGTKLISEIDRHNLNLLKLLSDYDTIFGVYELVPRVYSKSSFVNGNIFDDFFVAAGLPMPEAVEYPDRSTSNISRSRLYIEILRLANERRPASSHAENMLKIDQFLGEKAFKSDKSGYNFLSIAEQNVLMNEFAENNAEVARKYFGRDDGILFDGEPSSSTINDHSMLNIDNPAEEAGSIYETIFKD